MVGNLVNARTTQKRTVWDFLVLVWIVVPTSCFLLFVLFASGLFGKPSNEVVSQLTSPDGRWTVTDEFDGYYHLLILRDAAGKEIARDQQGTQVDTAGDYQLELAITDDTAGTRGCPVWRLDPTDHKWHVIPSEVSGINR